MKKLVDMECIPCRGDSPRVTEEEIAANLLQIPEWEIIEVEGVQRLQRVFGFKNFVEALAFTNRIGELAEKQDHHPALLTEWGRVSVTWWTHMIEGLHNNDFVSAAKTDGLYNAQMARK
jgi:4a-hydroxytetrahydrobiopterin dehydratase